MKSLLHILSMALTGVICSTSCVKSGQTATEADDAITASIFDDSQLEENPYLVHFDSMPPGGQKLRISPEVKSLPRQFNDSNRNQLVMARAIGIEPITDLRGCWQLRRPIERVTSCREFFIDSLTHSLPFLVPEASRLLKEIGSRFIDTLQARGGGDYRIKVTSILRTHESVRRLRRRNVNAVDSSTHRYGTTFDISYVNFICDSANTVRRTQNDLKNLLGEILIGLKKEGRCMVKYERKQGCFHITACPVPADSAHHDNG